MPDLAIHEVQIAASSMEDIRELLDVTGDLSADAEISVADGIVLRNPRVSKSSGFEGTEYLLQGVMAVVTTTSSALLIEWLRDKLRRKRNVTVLVDGEEVEAAPDDQGS
jgi:hypothetical protein